MAQAACPRGRMPSSSELGIDVRPLVISAITVASNTLLAELVNSVVDQPYLDEKFHIPQAQRYCKGDFDSYDVKLTTPPGLYYASLAASWVVYHARRVLPFAADMESPPCHSIPQLRYISLLALLGLPWLLSLYKYEGGAALGCRSKSEPIRIHTTIKPTSPMEAMTVATADPSHSAEMARKSIAARQSQMSQKSQGRVLGVFDSTLKSFRTTLEVHTIALLPPLWFFGFLYYTDVPSTVTVVAFLLASKRNKHLFASLLGCASLTFRQTNIVWILFAIGTSLLKELSVLGLSNGPLQGTSATEQLLSFYRLPLTKTITTTLRRLTPYSPVAILSIAFYARNGGIVLGDKDNHQATLHWVQPLYCVAMLSFFAWPVLLSSLPASIRSPRWWMRSIPSLTLLTMLCLAAIHYGTIAHPFLLADNRHYTFYIWRRLINRSAWSMYVLAPCYAVMLRIWWAALARENSLFWIIGFILCTCAAIVPSPLIEPRYFLIPYLIVRLHLYPDSKKDDLLVNVARKDNHQGIKQRRIDTRALAVEAFWYLVINVVCIYLFLFRPFRWPDSSDWQRFMW